MIRFNLFNERITNLEPEFNEENYLYANPDVHAALKNKKIKSGAHHYLKYGFAEDRPLRLRGTTRRIEKVLLHINTAGYGLEIGPSHNPIAPKSKGYNVKIVDHLDTETLKDKYRNHHVNLCQIEDVDYIWAGGDLSQLIGALNSFDWIIASHVIEHIPDLISFLQDCEKLLRADGVLALIIPDLNYCFDYLSPDTTVGQLLDAFELKRSRPSSGQIFDHFSRAVSKNNQIAWNKEEKGPLCLIHNFMEAQRCYDKSRMTNTYQDVHCWRFTPESFEYVVQELNRLNLLNLSINTKYKTKGCEFHMNMKLGNSNILNGDKRLESLIKIKNHNI